MRYTYTIATSFSSGLKPSALVNEINAAGIGAGEVAVTDDGTDCVIQFNASVTQSELDQVVAAHAGQDVQDKMVKLYDYVNDPRHDKTESPTDINYITGLNSQLFPKRTMVQGEVQTVEWYSDQALTDLVLKADIVYSRDAAGFATNRQTTRCWYLKDGTPHPDTKVTVKDYDAEPMAKIAEGKRRRGNIVNHIEANVAGMLLATETGETQAILDMGRSFMETYNTEINIFISASKQNLYTVTQADTAHPWLDNVIDGQGTTIRQWVLAECNIWGL